MAKADRARTQLPERRLTLVPEAPQKDVIDLLRNLLAHAEAGSITGIALGCVLKGNRYITDVAGYCATHPTFTRGMISSLSDELGARIHQSDPDGVR